jgi:hypothetical protein
MAQGCARNGHVGSLFSKTGGISQKRAEFDVHSAPERGRRASIAQQFGEKQTPELTMTSIGRNSTDAFAAVMPGWCVGTSPQMRRCASANPDILRSAMSHRSSMLRIGPE